MKKKLLIFDVDGTVWDSEKDVFLSFNHTLKENAGIEIDKDAFQELAGMHLGKMFEVVLPEDKKELSFEYEKLYKKYYIDEEHFADATDLFEGVKETLYRFKENGFYMAVASSKPKRILDKMVSRFDIEVFDYVLGTEESDFKHKPDPDIVNYIISQVGVDKKDAVIIGDSKSDILTGHNAGIDTIAVSYGYDTKDNLINANPTLIIDDFTSLQDIIKLSELKKEV